MNYRHAYHAGNFADVMKHAVLARVLLHLRDKPAAFRVIDTHAGAGSYDLAGTEAETTGEWRDGIGRLLDASLDDEDARALLAPYLEAVAAANPRGGLRHYPGSPALAGALMRPQDRLIACELEPHAASALARNLRGDARAKAIAIDGWTALSAYIPPKERRGVVLIDPPFEQPNEFSRLADALAIAHRKWPTGIYLLWYPIKDEREVSAFARRISRAGIPKLLQIELIFAARGGETGLRGSGLVALNPPWKLQDELKILLPALARRLASGDGSFRINWIAGESTP